MLIAAYTGCGKSAAAKLDPNVLDLPSMPYRWLLPYRDLSQCTAAEIEREKGALHHVADPRFPQNYVLEILKAERTGKTVLFPTIVPAINMLVDEYERDVLVVCPEKGLKEEYQQRFLKRGNSDSFLNLFIDDWETRIEDIEKSRGRHLYLKSGEYLSSVLVERSIIPTGQTDGTPVPQSCLTELEREIEAKGSRPFLWMLEPWGGKVCPVGNLDLPGVRETLDAIGRIAFQRDLYPPRILSEQLLHLYEHEGAELTWYKDLNGFYQALINSVQTEPHGFCSGIDGDGRE